MNSFLNIKVINYCCILVFSFLLISYSYSYSSTEQIGEIVEDINVEYDALIHSLNPEVREIIESSYDQFKKETRIEEEKHALICFLVCTYITHEPLECIGCFLLRNPILVLQDDAMEVPQDGLQ